MSSLDTTPTTEPRPEYLEVEHANYANEPPNDDDDEEPPSTTDGVVSIGNKTIFLNKKGKVIKMPGKVKRSEKQLAALEKGRQKLREAREAKGMNVAPTDPEQIKEMHEKKLAIRREKTMAKEAERLKAIDQANKTYEQLQEQREQLEQAKQAEIERVRAIREFREQQREEMERQHAAELAHIAQERKIAKEQRQKALVEQLTARMNEQYLELHRRAELERETRRNEKAQQKMQKKLSKVSGGIQLAPITNGGLPVGNRITQPVVAQKQHAPPPYNDVNPTPWFPSFSSDSSRALTPFVLRGMECESR
jgi:hypothetical protein